MMIRVIYSDKSTGEVASHLLDELIAAGRIVAFYRADGWVSLERGPIRGKGSNAGGYDGPGAKKETGKACEFRESLRITPIMDGGTMNKRFLTIAASLIGAFFVFQGAAFPHEGEKHVKKHTDAQMDKFHKIMPMYAQAQAEINGALEKGDAAAVEAGTEKILATIPYLKKSKPHKNLKKLDTFKKIAGAFNADVAATAAMAKKGDIAGAKDAFRKAGEKCDECHAKFRD